MRGQSEYITVYRHRIDDFEAPEYSLLLQTACKSLLKEVSVFRFAEDRIRKLVGRKLLQLAWLETGGQGEVCDCLQKGPYGKPFLPQWKYFNLSHSGSEIVLAVSDAPIGIDIEQCMAIDYNSFSGQLHPYELDHIRFSNDPPRTFFDIWTRKEALLKASGQGLTDTMNTLDCSPSSVDYQNRCWHFYPVSLDDASYVCCLVSLKKRPEINLQTISAEKLPGWHSVP